MYAGGRSIFVKIDNKGRVRVSLHLREGKVVCVCRASTSSSQHTLRQSKNPSINNMGGGKGLTLIVLV